MLARCTELRTLQVALALIVFREDFGDMKGWDEGIRSMLSMLHLCLLIWRPERLREGYRDVA